MKNSILSFRNGGGRNLVWILIFLFAVDISGQETLFRMELGVSYDQSLDVFFENLDNNPTNNNGFESAKGYISELTNMLQIILADNIKTNSFELIFDLRTTKRFSLAYPPGLIQKNVAVSNAWNKLISCNTYDLVHHLTMDLPGVNGHSSGGGLCKNIYQSFTEGRATATLSVVDQGNMLRSAIFMAHEIGHNLGMGHEFTSCFTNLMCTTGPGNVNNASEVTISASNKDNFRKVVRDALCTPWNVIGSFNNDDNPDCTNCINNVFITTGTPLINNIIYGCQSMVNNSFMIESIFENSCNTEREVDIRIQYFSSSHELSDVSDMFEGPFNAPLPNDIFDKYYTLNNLKIGKNQTIINAFNAKVIGNGPYEQNHHSTISVTYSFTPGSNNIPVGIMSNTYGFYHNYQIDKSAQAFVYASQLKIPNPSDNLNFCNALAMHDIYINGEFIIDINQTYCKTNFYFGPNAKVTINAGKTLTLNNCKLTSCDDKWQGINIESLGILNVENKSEISNAMVGIKSLTENAVVTITGASIIKNCNNGVQLNKSLLYPLLNSTFANCINGINLTNCGIVNVNGCTFDRNETGILSNGTNLTSNSNYTGKGNNSINSSPTSTGILFDGNGEQLSIIGGTFKFCSEGINSKNTKLDVCCDAMFLENYIGISRGNAPLLATNILSTDFLKNNDGMRVDQYLSNSNLSTVKFSTFTDNKFGAIFLRTNSDKGWHINLNTFNVPFVGIRTLSSSKIDIDDNDFIAMPNSRFSFAKDMVNILGGRDNKIHENTMAHLSNSSESAQMRNIYVANASNTQVHCNILNHGTYGLNVWGAAPSLISANTFAGSHTGMYYGLYPDNGNVATGIQNHHGNVWERNTFALTGAKHLGTIIQNVELSSYIVDQLENPKYNIDFIAVTNWIRDLSNPAVSNNCANPPLSGTSINAGGSSGSGSSGGSGSGGSMALSISSGDVPFTDYSVPLNQALDQQLYTSVLNGDNSGLTASQISTFTNTLSSSPISTIAQASNILHQPIAGSSLVNQLSNDLHSAIEVYYQASQDSTSTLINTLYHNVSNVSTTLSAAYQTYRSALNQNVAQAQGLLNPLLTNADPYIQAQAYVMHVELALMIGDSITIYNNKLTQIANSCPLELGDAVYGARGLLESQTFQDITYNDNILCQSTTPRATNQSKANYSVYPNPTLGIFSINNAKDIKTIRITNKLGSIEQEILNSTNIDIIDIDLSTFTNGVYFVEIINKDRERSMHKIILLK